MLKRTNDKKKIRFYLFCYDFTDSEYPIHIKYGITTNIQKRIVQLQTPVKPYRIIAMNFDTLYKVRKFENCFSKIFQAYKANGEWLIINNKEQLNTISHVFDHLTDFCENIGVAKYVDNINFKTK